MSQIAKTAEVPAENVAASPPLRVVTAASLFDGHDAAINLMRRLIQSQGCEGIHLGHNRSVAEIVRAAICEDADGSAESGRTSCRERGTMWDAGRERWCSETDSCGP